MPNDKDQKLSPDEEPEEKYSFLQETIKPKPVSRQQLVRQVVRIAIYGVILGAFACLGFFALKPVVQDAFRGDPETVTIPEDEEPEDRRKNLQKRRKNRSRMRRVTKRSCHPCMSGRRKREKGSPISSRFPAKGTGTRV